MKKIITIVFLISISFYACNEPEVENTSTNENMGMGFKDDRISLNLNPMQKRHQLINMRSHLEAVQEIIFLLSEEEYNEASIVAELELGSTTEMKLMCASFGDENFEKMGLTFHENADKMSEIFREKDTKSSLKALSKTINNCVQCHATYRQ